MRSEDMAKALTEKYLEEIIPQLNAPPMGEVWKSTIAAKIIRDIQTELKNADCKSFQELEKKEEIISKKT